VSGAEETEAAIHWYEMLKIRPPLPFTTEHATQLLSDLDDVLAGLAR
jgi:4-aminobutyrate aminotransferase-like enzyme